MTAAPGPSLASSLLPRQTNDMKPNLLSFLSLSAVTATCCALIFGSPPVARAQSPSPLKVSDDHRRLVTANGEPFFWLGDTAWELFHRLDRAEAEHYLDTRERQGFNVIQAVAVAELDGHSDPNPYGHLPFIDGDPARPAVTEGPDNDYWDHVDFIVDAANQRGLRVGFLPTWGRYWHDDAEVRLFNRENAEAYGRFLGERYKEKALIWILGGDRHFENDEQKEIVRAMARGLRAGDQGAHLITVHPAGRHGSAEYFHEEPWLDFNMRQNGHVIEYDSYAETRRDYDRAPIKPVIDGEPIYEDHPISFQPDKLGHSIAADVRRPMYWDLFGGACGHTYGHHSVWQMWTEDRDPINRPLMPWRQAIEQPGAQQMQYGRRLMESRPQEGRGPDDDVIVAGKIASAEPGAGRYRFVATGANDGSYAMVYVPVGRSFRVRLNKISGNEVVAWWYNPRNGEASKIGQFPKTAEREFISPTPGEELDWVLVLDDATKGFAAPGTQSKRTDAK